MAKELTKEVDVSAKFFYEDLFVSMQGESTDAGRLCIFLRLWGCPLNCIYCDQKPQGRKKIGSVRRLAKSILDISNVPYVCITGGEPLLQRELLYPLIYELMLNGKEVSVETSGCFPIEEEPYQRSFKYVMDIKCPSSGVEDKNIFDNIFKLQAIDEVKFVVQDRTDYDYALEVIRMYPIPCQILFSPVFAEGKPLISGELLRWMLEDNLINARISIQTHKILGVL